MEELAFIVDGRIRPDSGLFVGGTLELGDDGSYVREA